MPTFLITYKIVFANARSTLQASSFSFAKRNYPLQCLIFSFQSENYDAGYSQVHSTYCFQTDIPEQRYLSYGIKARIYHLVGLFVAMEEHRDSESNFFHVNFIFEFKKAFTQPAAAPPQRPNLRR